MGSPGTADRCGSPSHRRGNRRRPRRRGPGRPRGQEARGASGVRTLVAFKRGNKAFFMYGFAKNVRANINQKDLKALRLLAVQLLGYSNAGLAKALRAGELIEIEAENDD